MIAPIAERVARMLEGRRTPRSGAAPTPLTNTNRRSRTAKPAPAPKAVKLAKVCDRCGAAVPNNQRSVCATCLAESRDQTLDKMSGVGPKALDAWRATADTTTRQQAHAAAMATSAQQRFQRRHGGAITLDDYQQRIRPKLTNCTVEEIVAATGLSDLCAARVRNGSRTPDPRHWAALDRLTSQ